MQIKSMAPPATRSFWCTAQSKHCRRQKRAEQDIESSVNMTGFIGLVFFFFLSNTLINAHLLALMDGCLPWRVF